MSSQTLQTPPKTQTKFVYLFLTLILIVIDFYLGEKTLWWLFIVPAFLVGWLLSGKTVRLVTLSAVVTWVGRALYFDFPTGLRLSSRIAGIMNLPGDSTVAYLVTALTVGLLAALAAFAGASLRAGLLSRLEA